MTTKTFDEILEEYGAFCYTNVGVSMKPLIRQGRDVMKITRRDKNVRCRKYDVVLFHRPELSGYGEYVLHRILRVNDDGTYWIVGDNCFTGDTVPEDQIIGIMCAVVRNGRTVTTDNFFYRLYVLLWCGCYPLRFLLLRFKRRFGIALIRLKARTFK